MTHPLRLRPADDYVFHLDVGEEAPFEGPMDLLLRLIEEQELPITAVSLTQVTAQYMMHLAEMQAQNGDDGGFGATAGGNGVADRIAEFLVMAARLLYIKSAALLPPAPAEEEEEEEDPGETLARQLIEYKRFKEKAALLQALEASGRRGYIRLAPPPKLAARLDPTGLNLQILLDAFYDVLEEIEAPPRPVHTIAPLTITVEEKIAALRRQLYSAHGAARVYFRQFLGQAASRIEVIVSFLAILELMKRGQIRVQQSDLYGDILIEGV